MPAKNEAESIENVINEFDKEAKLLGISVQIQVIDDNSTDNTVRIVKSLGIKVFSVNKGTGLAEAFRKESEQALLTNADCIIHIDSDGQHDAKDLKLFIKKISEGFDLVLGNRLHSRPNSMSKVNYEANKFLSKIISKIIGHKIKDSQTGYRAIRREVLEKCQIKSQYTYSQEQIIKAAFCGYQIADIPINIKARLYGTSRQTQCRFKYFICVSKDLIKLIIDLKFNKYRQH